MSLMYVPRGGVTADPVRIIANDFYTFGQNATIYSGARFGADGNIYERQANGGWSNIGSWLMNGTAATYYLLRTIDSGTLTTDAGAGPLQMNANLDYDIQKNGDGYKTTTVTFQISNDVSGSPIVTTRTYIFEAERGLQ